MTRWWSGSHSIGSSPLKEAVVEPRLGGRWFERGQDGSECEWGRVLAWEPPGRIVLAWQIDAQWRFDSAPVTEVEVRFIPEGNGTRVELEHRNVERLGDQADAARAALDSPGGWGACRRASRRRPRGGAARPRPDGAGCGHMITIETL
jgi:uncharacterized protein YndB with AHSA1/START domain